MHLSCISACLPYIYLKGPGIEDTISWSHQGCNAGSGREQQRTKPSSLALISFAFFARCLSHPFVPQQHRPVRLYLNSLLPYVPPPPRTRRNACVWCAASACARVIIALQSRRCPRPTCAPISPATTRAGCLFSRSDQTSRGPLVSSDH